MIFPTLNSQFSEKLGKLIKEMFRDEAVGKRKQSGAFRLKSCEKRGKIEFFELFLCGLINLNVDLTLKNQLVTVKLNAIIHMDAKF